MSTVSHHHPSSLPKVQGQCPTPYPPPHTTYQLSTCNTAHTVYYVLDWCVELDWYMYWAGVLDWYGQSSTYNTPVQYIQHTSPVHTTHQSSAYNTPVQYIQHTSPVHTTHQSSTYNTPFQYIQHTSPTQDGWVSSKIKNGVAVSPENSVAVSPENRKGILDWKTCGFEIDASPFILYMYTTSVVL